MHTSARSCMHTYIHTYIHSSIHSFIHTYIHTYVSYVREQQIYMYIHICVYIYTYIYRYTCMHTDVRMHVRTCMHPCCMHSCMDAHSQNIREPAPAKSIFQFMQAEAIRFRNMHWTVRLTLHQGRKDASNHHALLVFGKAMKAFGMRIRHPVPNLCV